MANQTHRLLVDGELHRPERSGFGNPNNLELTNVGNGQYFQDETTGSIYRYNGDSDIWELLVGYDRDNQRITNIGAQTVDGKIGELTVGAGVAPPAAETEGEFETSGQQNIIVRQLTANLFVPVATGDELKLISVEDESVERYVTVVEGAESGGEVTIDIQDDLFRQYFPIGSHIILDGAQFEAKFSVDPSRIVLKVNEERELSEFGTLVPPSGTSTEVGESLEVGFEGPQLEIASTNVSADNPVRIVAGEKIQVYEPFIDGETRVQEFTVSVEGGGSFSSSPFVVPVEETTFTQVFTTKALVREPAFSSSSRISVLSDEISLVAQTANGASDSVASLEVRVGDNEASISSQASLIDGNSSAIASTTSRVSTTETQIGTLNQSVTDIENTLEQNDVTAIAGLQTSVEGIEGDISTITARAVLTTNVEGNIATIDLESGVLGDAITIEADSVSINDIEFIQGQGSDPGEVRTSDYSAGFTGWRIGGDGNAEFNNVQVRSANFSSNNSGFELIGNNVQVNGDLSVGAGNSGSFRMLDTSGGELYSIRTVNNLASVTSNANITEIKTSSTIGASTSQLVLSFFNADSINGEHILSGSSNITNYRTNIRGDLLVLNDIDYYGTLTDLSDKLAKENVEPLGQTLDKITQLDAKVYELIGHKSKREIGLFAQDVEPLFPEAVGERTEENEEGEEITYKTLSYIQLIPALIESVKELKQQNEELKTRIEALEQQS